MDTAEKFQLGLSYLLRITLVIALVFEIYYAQWLNLFLTLAILILTFIPAILTRNYRITLPIELEFVINIFIFGALYLGDVQSFYVRFWWWDSVLHGFSALILGCIGFLIVYIINYETKVPLQMMPKFVALFSFTFSLAIGAIWEIFEFMMDQLFGFNTQQSGLVDTMWDLIIDTGGALIASFLGYWYIKKGESPFFSRIIRKFVEKNPKIFKRRNKEKSTAG